MLPSNKALAGAGIELIGMPNREFLLRDALATLQEQYDYIFIDCPPIDVVADASIITEVADMTIFVLRADMLDKKVLPVIENLYRSEKYSHMAIILNGVDMQYKRYGYGGSGRYGYGYGYGYGE